MLRLPIRSARALALVALLASPLPLLAQRPASPMPVGGAVRMATAADTVLGGAAPADSVRMALATQLLDSMHYEAVLHRSVSVMLDAQLQANPLLQDYRDVLERFFEKYMSMEHIGPPTAALYAQRFTAPELRELIAFYSTPVGRKLIEMTPDLMQEGTRLGQQIVQEHTPELMSMMNEQMQRTGGTPSARSSTPER
ncbi:MAG TPA: DUF2059 domain-containing protein [Gemmatimonadaceae bacterium]|nr:DUF2059 domain-containing protein [Gemmatimonadaceae bacterium]